MLKGTATTPFGFRAASVKFTATPYPTEGDARKAIRLQDRLRQRSRQTAVTRLIQTDSKTASCVKTISITPVRFRIALQSINYKSPRITPGYFLFLSPAVHR
jgi:hypothetical protein